MPEDCFNDTAKKRSTRTTNGNGIARRHIVSQIQKINRTNVTNTVTGNFTATQYHPVLVVLVVIVVALLLVLVIL